MITEPAQIVALRERLGYSQSQFADLLIVSRPTVARWENGTTAPSGPSELLLSGLYTGDITPETLRQIGDMQ